MTQWNRGRAGRASSRGGFTLVELITVITILAILVTLGVGGIQAVQRVVATNKTRAAFRAIEAGLDNYYADRNAFPWYANTSTKFMAVVDSDLLAMVNSIPLAEQKAEYILYVALNLKRGKGPYISGGNLSTVLVPAGNGSFAAYADGWDRPIQYEPPANYMGKQQTKPHLISLGAKANDDDDNLDNYRD